MHVCFFLDVPFASVLVILLVALLCLSPPPLRIRCVIAVSRYVESLTTCLSIVEASCTGASTVASSLQQESIVQSSPLHTPVTGCVRQHGHSEQVPRSSRALRAKTVADRCHTHLPCSRAGQAGAECTHDAIQCLSTARLPPRRLQGCGGGHDPETKQTRP